jgi:hypothetical protein
MRFSIFTPTHRPAFLNEAFDSLLAQSQSDWEWVLVPGDYLVELDHDDLLTPEALAKIGAAIDATGAEFLYSDFANFRADGSCEVYDQAYGVAVLSVRSVRAELHGAARVSAGCERAAPHLLCAEPCPRLEPRRVPACRRPLKRLEARAGAPVRHMLSKRGTPFAALEQPSISALRRRR